MAEAFRITQEIDFFDVSDYEERAATYETLHSAAERSMRDDRIRRAVVLVGACGFLALFWNVVGGPGAEAQASSAGASVITAPSEALAAAAPVEEFEPIDVTAAAIEAEVEAEIADVVPGGPSPWGVAKGFDVLDEAPEEVLEAELSDNLLSRLKAPPPAPAAPKPVARKAVTRTSVARKPVVRRAATPAAPAPPPAAKSARSETLEIAVTLHDEGRSDEALRVLRKLGSHPEAILLKGSIYQDKGDPVAARELYEGYLKRHPTGGHARAIRSILSRL